MVAPRLDIMRGGGTGIVDAVRRHPGRIRRGRARLPRFCTTGDEHMYLGRGFRVRVRVKVRIRVRVRVRNQEYKDTSDQPTHGTDTVLGSRGENGTICAGHGGGGIDGGCRSCAFF